MLKKKEKLHNNNNNKKKSTKEWVKFNLTQCFVYFILISSIHRLIVCVSLKIHVAILTPKLMGGTFSRWVGHKGRALLNGIAALVKEISANSCPFPPCEDTGRIWLFMYQDAGFHQTSNLLTYVSCTFWPPELWVINFCCLKFTKSM